MMLDGKKDAVTDYIRRLPKEMRENVKNKIIYALEVEKKKKGRQRESKRVFFFFVVIFLIFSEWKERWKETCEDTIKLGF